jgi:hypothetical protein
MVGLLTGWSAAAGSTVLLAASKFGFVGDGGLVGLGECFCGPSDFYPRPNHS